MGGTTREELLDLTVRIVVAHVEHNEVSADAVPDIVSAVYNALATAGTPDPAQQDSSASPQPAVPIRRSVFPEYLVCLEDGKKMTMLRRYLLNRYNITSDDYRRKWRLPSDYPMVAPNYAKRRSEMAKSNGLGRK